MTLLLGSGFELGLIFDRMRTYGDSAQNFFCIEMCSVINACA